MTTDAYSALIQEQQQQLRTKISFMENLAAHIRETYQLEGTKVTKTDTSAWVSIYWNDAVVCCVSSLEETQRFIELCNHITGYTQMHESIQNHQKDGIIPVE